MPILVEVKAGARSEPPINRLHRMRNHKYFRRNRLIVFGRYPVPGRVKTRLIPAIGPAGAADLQRWLTEKTLETAKAFAFPRGIDVEVCFEGGTKQKMRRWLGSGVSLSRQTCL
ncbi:MAG: hypothetical protein J7M30_00570 [Deltaproteobacteria bacterium]|nr:hypothetical protein [Deltaproteobacteria bacterium]